MRFTRSRLSRTTAIFLAGIFAGAAGPLDDETVGSVIGGQVEALFQSIQQARAAKRNLNAAIASGRTAWQACKRKCAKAKAIDHEFAKLLLEKDLYYLNFDIARRATSGGGQGSAAAELFGPQRNQTLDSMTRLSGGEIDSGLVRNCRPAFLDWSRSIYRGMIDKRTGLPSSKKFVAAFKASVPRYSEYRKCRDAYEVSLLSSDRPGGNSGGATQQCPRLGKLAEAGVVWGQFAAQTLIGQNKKLYDETVVADRSAFSSKKIRSLSIDLAPQYSMDPNLGFRPHSTKVLRCRYLDACPLTRSPWFFYWYQKQPAPTLQPGWAKSLLPNSPFSKIGNKRYQCPAKKPADTEANCDGCLIPNAR
ncbi:MAG: hypothetical protein AB7P12_11710 [Alphaproteobacteria bacterium]